jgi:hypothetical protein
MELKSKTTKAPGDPGNSDIQRAHDGTPVGITIP